MKMQCGYKKRKSGHFENVRNAGNRRFGFPRQKYDSTAMSDNISRRMKRYLGYENCPANIDMYVKGRSLCRRRLELGM